MKIINPRLLEIIDKTDWTEKRKEASRRDAVGLLDPIRGLYVCKRF